jgi:hypothetical protein
MDDPKQVFIYKYEKLCEMLKDGPEVQLLDIAAILRHLLVDKQTLYEVINQEYRLPIRFKVSRSASETAQEYPMCETKDILVFSDITWPQVAPLKEVKKDDFLDFDLLLLEETKFTVKHIIKFCANQLGGIHFEINSTDPDDIVLRNLNNAFKIYGASTALSFLRLIGNITIQALNELYTRVSSDIKE